MRLFSIVTSMRNSATGERLDWRQLLFLPYLFGNDFTAALIYAVSARVVFGIDNTIEPIVYKLHCAVVLEPLVLISPPPIATIALPRC